MASELSLDELFIEARKAHKAERTAAFHAKQKSITSRMKTTPVEEETPLVPAGIFANPENWTEGRGLALIHRASRQLLGNFREWTHRSVPDARRLVRSESPIAVVAVEEVDFGVADLALPPTHSPRLETQQVLTRDLVLETPAVRAQGVLVTVHYFDQWTAKVVLIEATSFVEGMDILQLPAGVDVLQQLTRECKAGMRRVK